MADFIKVDSEQMRQTAESISIKIGVITSEFDNIMTTVSGSASYWQGDAAEAYRRNIITKQDKVERFLRRLEEYVGDLDSISTVYETAEVRSQQISADLETDVIY